MSQEFYVKEILPKHIKEIKALEERYYHHFGFKRIVATGERVAQG
jgi:hypothetical protein